MVKALALVPFMLWLIAVACGGAASPTPAATQAPAPAPTQEATLAPTEAPTATRAASIMPTEPPQPTVATTSPTPTVSPQPTATASPTLTPLPEVTPTPTAEPSPVPSSFDANMKNFSHQDVTVRAGTTVVWTNRDPVQHTVTSGSPSDPDAGSLFDSGSSQADWVVQGETYSFTFNEAGVFPYYCRIHGAPMSGTITVTPVQPAAVAPAPTPTPISAATPTAEPAAASSDFTTEANIQDFTHQDLTVQIGTKVVWTNRDGTSHTTKAVEGQWDSGTLREGQSFSFTFTEAGVFSYFCAIHRSMTAEVTVNN